MEHRRRQWAAARARHKEKHPEASRHACAKNYEKDPERRKAQYRKAAAVQRAKETPEDTLRRKQRNKDWWASRTPEQRAKHQQIGRESMRRYRATDGGHRHSWWAKYGLTVEEHKAMKDHQGGLCALCRIPPKKFYIDHDHTTGNVRALLCQRCNLAVAYFESHGHLATRLCHYLRIGR